MATDINDGFLQTLAVGGETEIDFDFTIYAAADLQVLETDLDGVITELELGVDYSIPAGSIGVNDPEGGTIDLLVGAYPTGATAGFTYTCRSNAVEKRITDFQQGGDFFAATLNTQLDYLTVLTQQLRRDLSRAVRLPLDSPLTEIFTPAPESLKFLRWNLAADGLENVSVADSGLVTFPGVIADNTLVKSDGPSGQSYQATQITEDDSGNVIFVGTLTTPGVIGTGGNLAITGTVTPTGAMRLINTGLQILDTNASHYLSIVPGSDLTANRVFTLTTGDAARTLDISAASVTISSYMAGLLDDTSAATARGTLGFANSTTDNTVPRIDGTQGATQTSAVVIDDSNNMSGIGTLDIGTALTLAGTGTKITLNQSDLGSDAKRWSINNLSSNGNFILSTDTDAGVITTQAYVISRSGTDVTGHTWNTTSGFYLFNTGIIRGSALHNNATAAGSNTEHEVRSGTYTPTLTNTTNVAASTAYKCQWLRVGNVVTVSGKVDIDPTAAANTVLNISLPIASNIGAVQDCCGAVCGITTVTSAAAILGDAANNNAALQYTATDTGNKPFYFSFTYEVLP